MKVRKISAGQRNWLVIALVILTVGCTPASPATLTPTSAPTAVSGPPTAISTVTANSQWTPIIQKFNGVDMVEVPPGCFMMGSADGRLLEKPVNKQCFDAPFWIDKTEVTQGQFKQFGGQAAHASKFSGDNRPVEQITWFEAWDYCAKRGARLPTEAEWEYAARGPDNLIYVWGNTFVAGNAVDGEQSNYMSAEVGSKPADVSWVGALDLSGNVQEWLSSAFTYYPYDKDDGRENPNDKNKTRASRGSSWAETNPDDLRAAYRGGGGPSDFYGFVGVRCARSS